MIEANMHGREHLYLSSRSRDSISATRFAFYSLLLFSLVIQGLQKASQQQRQNELASSKHVRATYIDMFYGIIPKLLEQYTRTAILQVNVVLIEVAIRGGNHDLWQGAKKTQKTEVRC